MWGALGVLGVLHADCGAWGALGVLGVLHVGAGVLHGDDGVLRGSINGDTRDAA